MDSDYGGEDGISKHAERKPERVLLCKEGSERGGAAEGAPYILYFKKHLRPTSADVRID